MMGPYYMTCPKCGTIYTGSATLWNCPNCHPMKIEMKQLLATLIKENGKSHIEIHLPEGTTYDSAQELLKKYNIKIIGGRGDGS
jgi:hypothetical protein